MYYALIIYLFGPAVLAGYHDTKAACEKAALETTLVSYHRTAEKYLKPEPVSYACVPVKWKVGE